MTRPPIRPYLGPTILRSNRVYHLIDPLTDDQQTVDEVQHVLHADQEVTLTRLSGTGTARVEATDGAIFWVPLRFLAEIPTEENP